MTCFSTLPSSVLEIVDYDRVRVDVARDENGTAGMTLAAPKQRMARPRS
jgi:hypothetical protein